VLPALECEVGDHDLDGTLSRLEPVVVRLTVVSALVIA
jgi:hypothetical protein